MPLGYEETRLWKCSIGERDNDSYATERGQLRAAYHLFRERAAVLAAEIPQDLREYTVHDATHMDALWEMADIIAGPGLELTPTEGFVLGGAFLVHDLGMGLAAWPEGLDSLLQDSKWRDIVAVCMNQQLGRPATSAELESPPAEVLSAAKEIALRELHAVRAGELALTSWEARGKKETYHLIDDVDLRKTYGGLIGRLAESHWWDIDKVAHEFGARTIGAPVTCPDEWTVNPLKLACLLRLADAAHLDARRAPGFLRAVRRPHGFSDEHWVFQEHLQRPIADADRLVFTASRPFEEEEASSWWLCYETLQMVDRELAAVDALFADRRLPRMAIRSVKGADSPARLSELVPTSGWIPVDARVVVSNVPELARKLGGQSLYGSDPEVTLRELIQNASDGIRALRALAPIGTSTIHVRLSRADGSWWLEVADDGIGMSQQVMTGPLLDFGATYWGSQLMRAESQGLAASGFQPTGRFGIGFFSVFMLGDHVQVRSRRFDEASANTRVLEFKAGPACRPTIRPARGDEVRHMGGTVVRIKLKQDPYEPGGLLNGHHGRKSLSVLCARLAPALDCNVCVEEDGGPEELCVRANDWKTMPAEQLLMRLAIQADQAWTGVPFEKLCAAVRTITRDGEVIARATLPPIGIARLDDGRIVRSRGVVTAGGLSVSVLQGAYGIFTGTPTTVVRNQAIVEMSLSEMQEWTTGQQEIWAEELNSVSRAARSAYAGLLMRLAVPLANLKIFHVAGENLDEDQLRALLSAQESLSVVTDNALDIRRKSDGSMVYWDRIRHLPVNFHADVCIIRDDIGMFSGWEQWEVWPFEKPWDMDFPCAPEELRSDKYLAAKQWWFYNQNQISGRIVTLACEAWGMSLDDVLKNRSVFGLRDEGRDDKIVVGTYVDSGEDVDQIPAWRICRS